MESAAIQSVSDLKKLIASGHELLLTEEAAKLLRYKAQTLRKWACYETGPIRPIRMGGKLLWRISDIQKLIDSEVAGDVV